MESMRRCGLVGGGALSVESMRGCGLVGALSVKSGCGLVWGNPLGVRGRGLVGGGMRRHGLVGRGALHVKCTGRCGLVGKAMRGCGLVGGAVGGRGLVGGGCGLGGGALSVVPSRRDGKRCHAALVRAGGKDIQSDQLKHTTGNTCMR